ncbi:MULTISPECIES: hypothetical protein [Pseudomonas]|jgi:hypothetical protein|uniref:hypothetical protein n=1 Tax=Pseudomonas TaxID=286 RepID=UPI0004E40EF3|nr:MULTISPECIES: hypothetical protein [Pseudomonas]KFE47901.1 hypothetical protein IV03_07475 [Pseudomonas congelans]MBC8801000.1 hypothetical protein [Pseudomonas congelans]MBP1148074.1 hypothetical protein [Pseudomonas sp. PvP027]PBQ02030.1 hypothetical protein CCL07_15960 [Pseudomonas congelans]PBQ05222.1 hypothetical protein CCL17_05375 [Pseudomonas congelans]
MSASVDCVKNFKYLVRRSPDHGMGYSERLHFHAKEIGFNNFDHFLLSLAKLSDDRIGKINTKLMRLACARTMPKPSRDYFEFIAHKDRRMRFYSHWIGWDKRGQEVRVPSLMNASYRVPNLRERLDAPIYIIETRPQLLAWRHKWQGMAYVVQELAERELRPAFDREPDVVPGVREEVIDLEEDYTHNYATWYPSGK